MSELKDKFLAKVGGKGGSKKSVENLVVFVIILVVTIIFINYIWKDDSKNKKQDTKNGVLAESSGGLHFDDSGGGTDGLVDSSDNLERKLEGILKNINGVEDAQVLITYSETNKIVPMYNEDNSQSVTKEEDTRRAEYELLMRILAKKRLCMKNIMDRKML